MGIERHSSRLIEDSGINRDDMFEEFLPDLLVADSVVFLHILEEELIDTGFLDYTRKRSYRALKREMLTAIFFKECLNFVVVTQSFDEPRLSQRLSLTIFGD